MKKKFLVSILISNYNKKKFLQKNLKSCVTQSYKNKEIIIYDDCSIDGSIKVIKKFKKIKLIKGKVKKFNSSPLNQINALLSCFKLSKGKLIFLLDSDDYFREDKIEKVVDFFLKNKNENIVFDYPIIKKNNEKISQNKKINFFNTYWGYIHPTSCISIRRRFSDKLLDKVISNKFSDIWLDIRILLFSKYLDKYNVINDNLTFYRQFEGNISSKFKKFSKSWWQRRNLAHEYFINFKIINNLKVNKNLDFYISKLINKFL